MKWVLEVLPNFDSNNYMIPTFILGDRTTFNFRYFNQHTQEFKYIWNPNFTEGEYILVPEDVAMFYPENSFLELEYLEEIQDVKRITIKPLDFAFYKKNMDLEKELTEKLTNRFGLGVGEIIELSGFINVKVSDIINNQDQKLEYGKICNNNVEIDFEPMDGYEEELTKDKKIVEEMQRVQLESQKEEQEKQRLAAEKQIKEFQSRGGIVFGRSIPEKPAEKPEEKQKEFQPFQGKGRRLCD